MTRTTQKKNTTNEILINIQLANNLTPISQNYWSTNIRAQKEIWMLRWTNSKSGSLLHHANRKNVAIILQITGAINHNKWFCMQSTSTIGRLHQVPGEFTEEMLKTQTTCHCLTPVGKQRDQTWQPAWSRLCSTTDWRWRC